MNSLWLELDWLYHSFLKTKPISVETTKTFSDVIVIIGYYIDLIDPNMTWSYF